MTPAEAIAETLIKLGGPKHPNIVGGKPNSWHPQDFSMTPEEAESMEQAIEEQFERMPDDHESETW